MDVFVAQFTFMIEFISVKWKYGENMGEITTLQIQGEKQAAVLCVNLRVRDD